MEKIKIIVFKDEWWPVYSIDGNEHGKLKIGKKRVERMLRIATAFTKLQIELSVIYKKQEAVTET